MDFADKAKDFADKHDEQVDKRTDHKYSSQIDKGVDEAQRRTGDGDTRP